MSEQQKKVSLNVVPDPEKLANVVNRAENSRPNAAHNGTSSADEATGPEKLLPPADWPIERKLLYGKIIGALKTVYDPEIPIDIFELGLIYHIEISPENAAVIRMTLTAPGCPVAGQLVEEVENKVENIPEIREARVDLVWEPPWTRERMSEAARLHLGL